MITFDGPNNLIILSAGTTTLNVRDLWSRWIDWTAAADNAKFLPAFSQVGGDVIDASSGTSIPSYVFLLNGWRIRPQEASHTLNVSGGVLLVQAGGDPFVDTLGSFIVRINYRQPVQAVTVATGGGSGASASDIAAAVWGHATALALSSRIAIAQAILQNKTVTDPVTGIMTVFASDGVTPLLTASLFENVAQTQPYRGQGADVRGALA